MGGCSSVDFHNDQIMKGQGTGEGSVLDHVYKAARAITTVWGRGQPQSSESQVQASHSNQHIPPISATRDLRLSNLDSFCGSTQLCGSTIWRSTVSDQMGDHQNGRQGTPPPLRDDDHPIPKSKASELLVSAALLMVR